MILYYDNYIIDQPLAFATVKSIQDIRNGNTIYRMPSKLDIAKYTIASYKVYTWSSVIIKVDAYKKEDKEEFIKYAKNLFPEATIIPNRSDNQKEYCKTINEIFKSDDEWIFYMPNNDHPMMVRDINYLNYLLGIAKEYKKYNQYVSIIITMFSEYCGIRDNNPYFYDATIIRNDDSVLVTKNKKGFHMSGKIVHRDILKHVFCSKDFGNKRITRFEDIEKDISIPGEIIIHPKTEEICVHFDGHPNTYGTIAQITPDQVPPLFIPSGFFENNIKISYGYDKYKKRHVNINPLKKKYIFRRKRGTDLKIGLEDIPLFWINKISEININCDADFKKLSEGRKKHYNILHNPWKSISYRIQIRIKSFLYQNIYVKFIMMYNKHLNKYIDIVK